MRSKIAGPVARTSSCPARSLHEQAEDLTSTRRHANELAARDLLEASFLSIRASWLARSSACSCRPTSGARRSSSELDLQFFERICEQAPAEFILQRETAGGALASFMLVFHLGDRVINKFIDSTIAGSDGLSLFPALRRSIGFCLRQRRQGTSERPDRLPGEAGSRPSTRASLQRLPPRESDCACHLPRDRPPG